MADVKKKSGSEVAQLKRSRGRAQDYWAKRLFRRSFVHNGKKQQAKDWSVRIQHAGKRQTFNLDTANQAAAAVRAKERYEYVKAHGWEAAIRKYKYGDEKAEIQAEKEAVTVGAYFEMVRGLATDQSSRTIQDYGACLRRVVGEIIGKPLQNANAKKIRAKIDATPLEKITAVSVERWKATRLKKCEGNPLSEQTAKTTMNTILRQCRVLFGKKFVPKLRAEGVRFPDPLPFQNVELFKEDTSGKFSHQIDPEELVREAVKSLGTPRIDDESDEDFELRGQKYLAFILCFATGLRKREADTLEWSAVDFQNGKISIETTEFFKPKTKASAQPVALDRETLQILHGFKARYPKDRFVLRSDVLPRPGVSYSFYRAEETWAELILWLKGQGITDPKPIHYCRKAITAMVAKKFGIFAAQRHARHTTPQVTARFYSDSEESVAPEIGGLFEQAVDEEEKVVEADFVGESKSDTDEKSLKGRCRK